MVNIDHPGNDDVWTAAVAYVAREMARPRKTESVRQEEMKERKLERERGIPSLVVKNHIQKRAVNLKRAVVIDQTQSSELVHEIANPRPGGADRLRKRFLADFPDLGRLGQAIFAESSQ